MEVIIGLIMAAVFGFLLIALLVCGVMMFIETFSPRSEARIVERVDQWLQHITGVDDAER